VAASGRRTVGESESSILSEYRTAQRTSNGRPIAYAAFMHTHDATTTAIGATAEDRAAEALDRHGYRMVERNYRCRVGELDIIAREGPTLVFVEVRSRRTGDFGSALEAVGWRKQRKVSRVAAHYIATRRPRFDTARFDVVAITGDEVVIVKDAWRLGDRF
jgi:putative endonuclease